MWRGLRRRMGPEWRYPDRGPHDYSEGPGRRRHPDARNLYGRRNTLPEVPARWQAIPILAKEPVESRRQRSLCPGDWIDSTKAAGTVCGERRIRSSRLLAL